MVGSVNEGTAGKALRTNAEHCELAGPGQPHDGATSPDWFQARLETFGQTTTIPGKPTAAEKPVTPTPEPFAGTPLAEAAAQKPQRVVGILLGGIIMGADANVGSRGVEQKLDQLQQLAASTKGTGVAILVQAVRTADKRGEACHSGDRAANKDSAYDCDSSAWIDRRLETERYLIYDGKMTKLDFKSQGAASDVAALVRDASLLAGGPQSKTPLNLILQSHGNADQGISTAVGNLDLPTLRGALDAGLKAGGRKQLDNIDFDSCLMGSVKVMQAMQGLTQTIDASSAPELAVGDQSGQNLAAILDFEMHNPQASPLDLANRIVELAKSGANGDAQAPGTVTLGDFDLSKLPQFQAAFDQFGQRLAEAASNPADLAAIKRAVDATTGLEGLPQFSQDRDLKKFADNLLSAMASGELTDPTGHLKEATNSFLQSLAQFRPSFFGESSFGFGTAGGITASLPGSDILNPRIGARALSPLKELIEGLNNILKEPPATAKDQVESNRYSGLPLYEAQLLFQHPKDLLGVTPGDGDMPDELKHLWQMQLDLPASGTPQQYAQAIAAFRDAAVAADKGSLGTALAKLKEPAAIKARKQYLHSAAFNLTPNWQRFISALTAADSQP